MSKIDYSVFEDGIVSDNELLSWFEKEGSGIEIATSLSENVLWFNPPKDVLEAIKENSFDWLNMFGIYNMIKEYEYVEYKVLGQTYIILD